MGEQNEINPYAAPKSETLLVCPVEERMKRPASVKWSMAMMILAMVIRFFLELQTFREHGWQLWTERMLEAAQDVLRVTACAALFGGGRSPWVFGVTVLILGLHLSNFAHNVWFGSPAIPEDDPASQTMIYIFGLLLCYHFYRFTFCRPSLTYFRILSEN